MGVAAFEGMKHRGPEGEKPHRRRTRLSQGGDDVTTSTKFKLALGTLPPVLPPPPPGCPVT